MKLYNTLTKQPDPVEPLDGNTVRIYSCGPTVYDHIHIGNLSSFVFADTLRRVVKTTGREVNHVMNFTDVDDKTIRRSQEKYPDIDPMEALQKLASEYEQIFLDDMSAVGNDVDGYQFIKATDSIEAMQGLINDLHDKGFAYLADDGVYFSIEAYQKSGKKYGRLTEITASSTSEARIQNDEYDKESAHDFALWKTAKPGEPAWDFELDGRDIKGRPGWHIECSAMSRQLLGQPFDIHTGGVDLIFPHHENEIAQSTAGRDDDYARHFAHNEHLLVDGQKMSKSLNNFYTLEDVKSKGYDPLAFRLLVLQGHYRKQGHFTWDNLEAAQNRLKSYQAFADLQWELSDGELEGDSLLSEATQMIKDSLQNDLDTPMALAALSELESQWLRASTVDHDKFVEFLRFLDDVLGLNLADRPNIEDAQYGLIHERDEARKAADWQKSDELRDKLAEQGIGLRDTPDGAIWYRL